MRSKKSVKKISPEKEAEKQKGRQTPGQDKRKIPHEKDAEKQKSYQIGYLGMGIIPLKRGRKGKRSSDIWTRNFKFS